MTLQRETRALPAPVEVRASDDGSVIVEGYAAVFDQPTNIGGMFTEVIARGAFRNALMRGDDVEFLINHDGLPIARTTAGNLQLSEDDHGLRISAQLDPSDPDVQRVLPKMRAKMLDQMSFAFQVAEGGQTWETSESGADVRTITDTILFDVSVVNRGAYPQTTIALRARDEARKATRRTNFSAAARRLRMKATLALKKAGSKA